MASILSRDDRNRQMYSISPRLLDHWSFAKVVSSPIEPNAKHNHIPHTIYVEHVPCEWYIQTHTRAFHGHTPRYIPNATIYCLCLPRITHLQNASQNELIHVLDVTPTPCFREKNRVIAVVQLINKQGIGDTTLHKSNESGGGEHFTAQDTAVIGSFLSLLGPHIFNSTMVKFKKNSKVRNPPFPTYVWRPITYK